MTQLSPYEAGMLLCFGASWPFALYKTWKTKSSQGKSFVFLWLVFLGYLSGILHKIFFRMDLIIVLYILNAAMVLADTLLSYRYRKPAGETVAARADHPAGVRGA
jgi:hypothetical protein